MKKFLLYFVLFLFIAGLATLAYGFWNAKKIRHWATAAEEIKLSHNVEMKEGSVEQKLNAGGIKNSDEFKVQLASFSSDLESISKENQSMLTETEKLDTPRSLKPIRAELLSYYSDSENQVNNLENVIKFTSQIFEVAIINGKMKPGMRIEEITNTIDEAITGASEINADILPDEVKSSGNELKVATENYLDRLKQHSTGNVDSPDEASASYSDFSQKLNDFITTGRAFYLNTLNELNSREKKINNDLAVLERVKFSVK